MVALAWYALDGINPDPWTAPEVAVGRRNGKVYPQVFKSRGLTAYQETVKEEFASRYGTVPFIEGDIDLRFYLWRNLAEYQGAKKVAHRQPADATNMQKALEDALQGVLYENDTHVRHVETWVIEQGVDVEPAIVIGIKPLDWPTFDWNLLPARQVLAEVRSEVIEPTPPSGRATDIGGIFG